MVVERECDKFQAEIVKLQASDKLVFGKIQGEIVELREQVQATPPVVPPG